jgi:NADP-dependent 3-hydroxy acid dehydrogenase YdfG
VSSSVFAVLCTIWSRRQRCSTATARHLPSVDPQPSRGRRGHRARPPAGHRRVEAEPRIDVEHVARGVVYMATLPLQANVQFMTVMATKLPYIGRG